MVVVVVEGALAASTIEIDMAIAEQILIAEAVVG